MASGVAIRTTFLSVERPLGKAAQAFAK